MPGPDGFLHIDDKIPATSTPVGPVAASALDGTAGILQHRATPTPGISMRLPLESRKAEIKAAMTGLTVEDSAAHPFDRRGYHLQIRVVGVSQRCSLSISLRGHFPPCFLTDPLSRWVYVGAVNEIIREVTGVITDPNGKGYTIKGVGPFTEATTFSVPLVTGNWSIVVSQPEILYSNVSPPNPPVYISSITWSHTETYRFNVACPATNGYVFDGPFPDSYTLATEFGIPFTNPFGPCSPGGWSGVVTLSTGQVYNVASDIATGLNPVLSLPSNGSDLTISGTVRWRNRSCPVDVTIPFSVSVCAGPQVLVPSPVLG